MSLREILRDTKDEAKFIYNNLELSNY